jgi:DNA ligase (NAD+)
MNQTKVDTSLPIDKRFEFLRYCAKLYETSGDSPISDFEYDTEYYELEKLDPNNSFFDEVGGIDEDHFYGTPVKHDIKMGSLSKSLDIDSYKKWLVSTYSDFSALSFVLEHKIDGSSLSLVYENGNLVRGLSRGDGTTGIDITENVKYVEGVKHKISYNGVVEVRGECYKPRKDFYEKWHKSVGGLYKNPRNFTAGSLNQKDPLVTKERGIHFIAYEVVRKDFVNEFDKILFLENLGFNTPIKFIKRTKVGNSPDKIVQAVKAYMDMIDRANLEYDIDGVVVKLNNCDLAKKMGFTDNGRKPKAHRAVKFPPEEKETVLKGIEVNVGRTGNLTPVGILEPVDLGGATISRVTLHNFGAIQSGNYNIGSVVVIAKKGDIIPQIVRVKKLGTQAIDLPNTCPACGTKVSWDENKVNLVCSNDDCVSQLNAKIDHWFKKIGTKGIGKGIIARLTDPEVLSWDDKPIISSLQEMYYMLDNDRSTEHPFRKYAYLKEQFGEKMYSNVVKSIKSVNELPLAKFIEALGIGKIGRMAADIVAIAPTVDDIDKITVDDIVKINGFAETKASNFVESWHKRRKEIGLLLKYITIKEEDVVGDKLKNLNFCFTGSFSKPRTELQDIVVKNGGKAASSVGKDTILVWDGEEQGNKYNKASSNGNKIISEDEFFAMIKD